MPFSALVASTDSGETQRDPTRLSYRAIAAVLPQNAKSPQLASSNTLASSKKIEIGPLDTPQRTLGASDTTAAAIASLAAAARNHKLPLVPRGEPKERSPGRQTPTMLRWALHALAASTAAAGILPLPYQLGEHVDLRADAVGFTGGWGSVPEKERLKLRQKAGYTWTFPNEPENYKKRQEQRWVEIQALDHYQEPRQLRTIHTSKDRAQLH